MIDKNRALEPIEFISLLHLTGDFYGHPFVLQPWEHEVLWDVYGTVTEHGIRQYLYAYLEIPKKNGKTELTAAVSIYHLYCDPPGGEIYCYAAEKKQAGLVYKAAKQMIKQDPALDAEQGGALKVIDSQKQIKNLETGTFLSVESAEAYSKHGINPSVIIFDELHAQPNRDLWDTVTFGSTSARREPLCWVITTAGNDPDRHSIGWEIHEKALKIRDGELDLPFWYAKIYGAPEDADIYDEKVWHDCNPSLGVSFGIEVLRREALEARNSEASERLFRWLRLNQWVSLKKISWLPLTLWDQTVGKWNRVELLKKRCYVGIDMSSIIDLTAAPVLFPPQEGIDDWRYLTYAWIPENHMKERIVRDHAPYDKFLKDKHLEATPGDRIDYRLVANRIEEFELIYDVQYYCGDPYQLEVLRQFCSLNIQRKFVEIPQTMTGMTSGMKELERLFRGKEITHEDNKLDRWSFGNVMIATDGNENEKPMKNKSIERIDPTVALINAMAGAVRLEQKRSIYETRGLVSL